MKSLVLDHTAVLALGAGNRYLSSVVEAVHHRPDWYVAIPALSLIAAAADRPGIDDHIGSLPALEVVALDMSATGAVGSLVHAGVDWRAAHAVHLAQPTVEWPDGRPVVTTTPALYEAWGVGTVQIKL
jgi:hypothetical protein